MIEFRNVRKVYPNGLVAVDGVSLDVPTGHLTCLVGTSGCGKTTLLKMMNRLIQPTSGDILVAGESVIARDPIELRRSIGYVIQAGGLMPHLSIVENIMLPQIIRNAPKAAAKDRAEDLMTQVGLPPATFANRRPRDLSGGQVQRVGLARALMSEPPILMMDEPFGALDPISRVELQDLLRTIQRDMQKTVLMVTHDLPEAFKLADEVVLLDAGQIVQKGTRVDFLERPATPFVRQFVDAQRGIAG